MSGITQLDLNAPVTREQYDAAIAAMHAFLDGELRNRNGWCSERHRYFNAIFPFTEVEVNDFQPTGIKFEEVPEDADLALLLRETRARLLWYAKNGTIDLDAANEVFRAGGLPEYKIKDEQNSIRLEVTLPTFNINVAADNALSARRWAEENLMSFIARVMDGKTPETGDLYVPASIVAPHSRTRVAVRERNVPSIDEADTLRPSYS